MGNEIIKVLKRIWYRLQHSNSSYMEKIEGKFYVKYKEGGRSVNMYYRNAKTYAEIFGGEVVEDF